jgi:hypothetical protein
VGAAVVVAGAGVAVAVAVGVPPFDVPVHADAITNASSITMAIITILSFMVKGGEPLYLKIPNRPDTGQRSGQTGAVSRRRTEGGRADPDDDGTAADPPTP